MCCGCADAHLHLQADGTAVRQEKAGDERGRIPHERGKVAQVQAQVRLAVAAGCVCKAQPRPAGRQALLLQPHRSVCNYSKRILSCFTLIYTSSIYWKVQMHVKKAENDLSYGPLHCTLAVVERLQQR